MRVPERLEPLLDQGVIEEVIRPLMSGKEAEVFLVVSDGEYRVAKVYKEATNRSFKHRSMYTEGRKVRNSRQQRAMAKKSKYGREETEAAWRNAEVDIVYRLEAAGVRVPRPFAFVDSVLVMELIGFEGEPSPRLVDIEFSKREARDVFDTLIQECVKMLLAGVVHGDLSDFNVLMGPDGPVIIDFPQAVDPAHNRNAKRLFIRDVRNLQSFLGRFDRSLRHTHFGEEIWALYERSQLTEDTVLTGRRPKSKRLADTDSLMADLEALAAETRRKREAAGLPPPKLPTPRPAKQPQKAEAQPRQEEGGRRKKRRRKKKKSPQRAEAAPASEPFDDLDAFLIVGD